MIADVFQEKADPPVPKDGGCYVCQKPRKPERSRKYAGDIAFLDPFCSGDCARKYWGVELPEGLQERSGSPRGRPRKDIWKDHGWDEVAA